MFEWWYQRAAVRYPARALLLVLAGGFPTGVLATAGTALYIDLSLDEFARLVLASWLLIWLPEFAVGARLGLRQIAPVSAWIRGRRDEAHTAAAWQAAARLPSLLLRQPVLYLAAAPGVVLWGFYAVGLLDLPGYATWIFLAASLLVYLYWAAVRFLAAESALRPLLDEIGRCLPSDTAVDPLEIPLRLRLFASMVAAILVTGIAVGGFSASGSADVRALGFALLGSAVAVVLVASWLIGLLASSVTRPIFRLRDAARAVGSGDLSVRVGLASTDESAELTQAFNQMVVGLAERERLREAFGTFVDPSVAERVSREGTDLRGEEVEASILFMDVRGFTSFSENAPAREVVAMLNELYELVVPLITGHGGHANKFIGDGLMAVFGAPQRHADHADRAVAAALEIAGEVGKRFEGRLEIGLGVNTGPVLVGTIGGGGRLDFTVIGDAVNTAARVESATRETGDHALITGETLRELSDGSGWEERQHEPLKGKTAEIKLYGPTRV